MKILKVKNILFSLLAIMAVAVFMTSCEQELLPNTVENPVEGAKTTFLFQELQAIAPDNINLQDQDAVDALVSQLDNDMLEKLIEGTAIVNYLTSKDLAEEYLYTNDPSQVKIPTINDFEQLLSPKAINEIQNEIEALEALKANCSESCVVTGYYPCWVPNLGWVPCAPMTSCSLSCTTNTVVLYEGNNATQDVVAVIDVNSNRDINFTQSSCCKNDEARSATLFNMRAGQRIALYDSSAPACGGICRDTRDDWIIITVLRNFNQRTINSFEPNPRRRGVFINDGFIRAEYGNGGNLNGKVSRFRSRN